MSACALTTSLTTVQPSRTWLTASCARLQSQKTVEHVTTHRKKASTGHMCTYSVGTTDTTILAKDMLAIGGKMAKKKSQNDAHPWHKFKRSRQFPPVLRLFWVWKTEDEASRLCDNAGNVPDF